MRSGRRSTSSQYFAVLAVFAVAALLTISIGTFIAITRRPTAYVNLANAIQEHRKAMQAIHGPNISDIDHNNSYKLSSEEIDELRVILKAGVDIEQMRRDQQDLKDSHVSLEHAVQQLQLSVTHGAGIHPRVGTMGLGASKKYMEVKELDVGARHIPSFIAIRHRHSGEDGSSSPCLCSGVVSSGNCSSAAHEAFCIKMDGAMQASSTPPRVDSETLSPYFSAPRDVVELSDELFFGSTANVRAEAIRPLEIDVVITYVNGSVPEWQREGRAAFDRWISEATKKTAPFAPQRAVVVQRRVQGFNERRTLQYVPRAQFQYQRLSSRKYNALEQHSKQAQRLPAYAIRQQMIEQMHHHHTENVHEKVNSMEATKDSSQHEEANTPHPYTYSRHRISESRPAYTLRPRQSKYQAPPSFDVSRFRDWNELLYALRSIFFHGMCQPLGGRRSDNDTDLREAFVDLEDGDGGCPRGTEPWILRNVYVVVPSRSHIPFWLDATHKRIRIVTDEDLKKGESDQPTFNSNVIETLLHRIPGLSRFFLYFNNDMMLGRRVSLFDYFRPVAPSRVKVKGIKLPHDPTSYMLMEPILYVDQRGMCGDKKNTAYLRTSCPSRAGYTSNAILLRRLNHNRQLVLNQFSMIPSHSHPAHLPFLIDRTILEEMMDVTLKGVVHRDHAFRADTDLWMAYLYPYYALLKREQFHAATVSMETPLVTLPRDASAGNGKLAEEFTYIPYHPELVSTQRPKATPLKIDISNDNWIAEKTAEAFFLLDRKSIYGFTMLAKMEDVKKAQRNLVLYKPLFITLNDDWPAESSTEMIHLFTAAAGLIPQGEASHGKRPKRYILRSFAEIEAELSEAELSVYSSCGKACKGNTTAKSLLQNVNRSWELLSMQEMMQDVTEAYTPAPWEL